MSIIDNVIIELFVFLVLIVLVLTDKRFSNNRKIFFLFLVCFFWLFSLIINKIPFLIIKDLFWYSLVLNCSFVFHVLILNRMFEYCVKKHYEYAGFIISRISFTLSLSGLLYLILYIFKYTKVDYWEYNQVYLPCEIKDKYCMPYLEIKRRWYLKYGNTPLWELFNLLSFLLFASKWLICFILLYFIKVFANYSIILLGKQKKSFDVSTILKIIDTYIIYYLLSLIIGIPRLYLIWIIQFFVSLYDRVFNDLYRYEKNLTKKELVKKLWKEDYGIWLNFIVKFYGTKWVELDRIYEKPYHPFFMFDLCKFLYMEYTTGAGAGDSWRVWRVCWVEDNIYAKFDDSIKYPIRKLYKYYPWEEMAIGYMNCWYLLLINDSKENPGFFDYDVFDLLEQGLEWKKKINVKDLKEFLVKVILEIDKNLTSEDIEVTPEFVDGWIERKNNYNEL